MKFLITISAVLFVICTGSRCAAERSDSYYVTASLESDDYETTTAIPLDDETDTDSTTRIDYDSDNPSIYPLAEEPNYQGLLPTENGLAADHLVYEDAANRSVRAA